MIAASVGQAPPPAGRSWRRSSSVHSVTACWRLSGGSDAHTERLVRARRHRHLCALSARDSCRSRRPGHQRTWREAKIRRRGPAIGKLRVPHSNQLTRAVLDLDDHVSFATMPLASHDPDASRPVPDVTAMDAV